jgi:dynein heavy chain
MAEASNAVNDIDRNAIVDIQKMQAPSDNIKFMMAGAMVLMGEPTDWKKGVIKALSNVNEFMNRLKTLDPTSVPEKRWKKVNDTYLKDPRFDPVDAKKISSSVGNICKWAHALYKYAIIVKDVAPKKAKFAEVSAVLKKAEAELKVKTDEVAEVKAKVAELEANMQKMLDEKEALEFEMDRSTKRMTRANKLVGLLADEGVRWKNTVGEI